MDKQVKELKTAYKTSNGTSGIIAVLLGLFFSVIGAFFAWWLIAKFSLGRALLKSFIFFLLYVISLIASFIFIGIFLYFIVWIVMLVMLYKDCANSEITLGTVITTEQNVDDKK